MESELIILLVLIASWGIIFSYYIYWAYKENFYHEFFYLGMLSVIALQSFGFFSKFYSNWYYYIISWLFTVFVLPFFVLRTRHKIIKNNEFDSIFQEPRIARGIAIIIISFHSFLVSTFLFWIYNKSGLFLIIWIAIIIDTLIPTYYLGKDNIIDAILVYILIVSEALLTSFLILFHDDLDVISLIIILVIMLIFFVVFGQILRYRRFQYYYNG